MSRHPDAVPAASLGWLLICQLAVLAPLALHLPWWLMALSAAAMLWRWQLHRGRGFAPGRWLRAALALAVAGLLAVQFRSFAMDAMVSLLVAGFVLKLTELRTRNDVYWLSFLTYFVVGTQLLYTTGFLGAVYGVVCLVLITGTLLVNTAATGTGMGVSPWRPLALMALQALPVMLVLFLAVPRLGSLWTVPLNNAGGITGVSDDMSPGDFASLIQSDELAFRATFAEGQVPASRDRYWRALVLDRFDGRTWEQGRLYDIHSGRASRWQNWREQVTLDSEPLSYEVMLEPTGKNWLYTLPLAVEVSSQADISRGYTWYQRKPLAQRQQYSVTSHLRFRAQPRGLSDWERRATLSLPDGYNPETRRVAEKWRAQAGSDEALLERFLTFIRSRFRYTLQPPVLGEHTVDEFLFEAQAGFCEHFSGSFVFFMRAAGIPARVVVGYQGGTLNPHEGYLTVRQLDAHAWAEIWLAGQGWIRVDPTAAVAPERIDRGVEYSLDETDSQMLGNAFGRRFAALARLQLRWDAFNYRWHRWVMDYDSARQQAFLERLLGSTVPWRVVSALIGAIAVVVAVILALFYWRQRPLPAPVHERLYHLHCRRLARAGYPRERGEPPRDYARRLARERPEWAATVNSVAYLFEKVAFADQPRAHHELRKLVRQFKPR